MNSERKTTRAESEMSEQLERMEPGSLRYKALSGARKFKSNWLDLGELLSDISRKNAFTRWGFESFEDYCRKELKIKRETAMKLVASFGYLRKHRPALAREESEQPVPDYKVIHRLVEAEQDETIREPDARELRKSVFDEGVGAAALRRKIQALAGEDGAGDRPRPMHSEKLKRAVWTLRRTLPEFDPDPDILRALDCIDDFIARIEE